MSSCLFFFQLGFTTCKAKQTLLSMKLLEKEEEKGLIGYRKAI